MRKISAMYRWSGGVDYEHTCRECKNLIKVQHGNKHPYKCLCYGNTNSESSDWKISNIACKNFNGTIPEIPIMKGIQFKRDEKPIEGQMSLSDFLEETI